MNYRQLKWEGIRPPLSDVLLDETEKYFQIHFPREYRECLKLYHGAFPKVSDFYVNLKDGNEIVSCLAMLLTADPEDPENIIDIFKGMGEYKTLKVMPIGDDGGGDYICLDFRANYDMPAVVYFQAELGDLLFVAPDFSGFCEMLFEPIE